MSKDIQIEANNNQQKLVNLLLRNGYIDEDYWDYISLFHEGSLSKNDHSFLLNVKSQNKTEFNHRLDKIGNLISNSCYAKRILFGAEKVLLPHGKAIRFIHGLFTLKFWSGNLYRF
ncbi:hypothetical protein EZS27_038188, partial [termite gut metagenome]